MNRNLTGQMLLTFVITVYLLTIFFLVYLLTAYYSPDFTAWVQLITFNLSNFASSNIQKSHNDASWIRIYIG